MIDSHLPVLLIVLPLIMAPFCVLFHRADIACLITTIVSFFCFIMSVELWLSVNESSLILYHVGNWPAPWGIQLAVDHLNSFVLLIVTGASLVTSLFARLSVRREIAEDRIYLFYTAYLLNLTGLSGVVLTGDAFNLFVFVEIASLSSYALISFGKSRQALYATFRYLVMGTIGATFILIGLGLLYAMTGTLNMIDLSVRIAEADQSRTIFTAACFILIGCSIKLALFPMHVWLPKAYTYAPSIMSVFLAATTTKVFVYVLIRYLFTVFGFDLVETLQLPFVVMILSCLAIFYGSAKAIVQTNIKSIFAYSSVAQIGYMVLGLSLMSVTGLTASILHLFNHALMKAALFMAAASIVYQINSAKLLSMQGLLKEMPYTSLGLVIAGLSLIGVPPTAGFISKWYLISAALEQNLWLIIVVILIGSLLSIVYIWKIVEVIYYQKEGETVRRAKEAPASMLIILWSLVLANVYFGISTEYTLGSANNAARQLLGL